MIKVDNEMRIVSEVLEKRCFSVRVDAMWVLDDEKNIFNLKSSIEGYQHSKYHFFS